LYYVFNEESVFENIDDLKCITLSSDRDINSTITNAIADRIFFVDQKVIILSNAESTDMIPTRLPIESFAYELVHCSATYDESVDGLFKGNIFSRHGRSDKITIKSDTHPVMEKSNGRYTLAFVRIDDLDEQSYKNQFLQVLGGQVHVQCDVHRLPLIISHQKSKCIECKKRRPPTARILLQFFNM
jgi:hypothetical protein